MLKRLFNTFTWLYLEAEKGAEGGAGEPPAQGTPPANNGGDSGQPPSDPNELPKWLAPRLEKERTKAQQAFLESLKVKDADELGNLIKLAREYEQSKLSESERTTKQIDTLTADLTKFKTDYEAEKKRADDLEKARVSDRVETALKIAANTAKAKNVNDVLILLNAGYADDVTKLVNDKGEVQDKAVETLIDKFRKDKPEHFSVAGPGSPSNRGGKTPTAKPKEIGQTFRL